MGTILAIDPGNIQSGYVMVEHDGEEIRRVLEAGKIENPAVTDMLDRKLYANCIDVAIEMIAGMGILVDYINQLRRSGVEKRQAIEEAGVTRLRPILMTALTTVLGLIPMVAGSSMGTDMTRPMAIVTIGGLVYGTLLTLFVVPCIYDLLNRKKDMREK